MKLFALLGVLALAACASPAAASPTFRSDGPNAEAYGAAEGYPVGRATAGRMPLRFMVGSFSHHYHLLRTREVPRGGPVSELRRADPDLALTYLYDARRARLPTTSTATPSPGSSSPRAIPSCSSTTSTGAPTGTASCRSRWRRR